MLGKETLEVSAAAVQPSRGSPCLDDHPARHWYSLRTCLLAVQILMKARCCLRGGRLLLGILREYVAVGMPCHETLRRWLLRIGVFELSRPIAPATDWIWIVDHNAPVGPEKVLLVIGVRRSLLLQKKGVLTHQDVQVLHLDVMASSTGDRMEQQLRRLILRAGVPLQIVSDHGSDLAKGIRQLRQDYPKIIDTYDISHKLACLLKGELANDERWQAFLAGCAKARPRLQQTQGSFLMPPEVRVKARYMNLDRQVDWALKRLAYLDAVEDPKLAKKLQLTATQARAWVEERIGWLRDFRADVQLYGAMMQIVRVAQTLVKKEGIRRDSATRLAQSLPLDLPDHPRLKRLIAAVKEHLVEEGAKLADDGRYLGSSDLIESLFGKHKLFTENGTHKGIGPNLLLLPLLTVTWTAEGIRAALESTSCQAATDWCKTMLGKGDPATDPSSTQGQNAA
jgi:hypothetical protein